MALPHLFPTFPRGFARRAGAVMALVVALATTAGAQDAAIPSGTLAARRPEVSRAELQAAATAAEQAGRTAEATALRARLRDGDFLQGDRMILSVTGGEKAFADTVVVGAGQVISLEGYPDISLRGVLRSEVRDHLTKELARYIRTPTVATRPLLRLTLQGGVSAPGFYIVPTDVAITDVIMQAGGPSANADLEKSVIRRAAETVLAGEDLQDAMRRGLTIDQLGLQSGDVIEVGAKKPRNTNMILSLVSAAATVIGLVITLTR